MKKELSDYMEWVKANVKGEKEVYSYGGLAYTLNELKELCPKKDDIKKYNELYEFTKRKYEKFYNFGTKKDEQGNLPEEVWVRLTQKDYGKYLVSNFSRIKVEREDGFHLIEQENEAGEHGYLILDPEKKFNVDHKTYVYTLVAYAFLGKVEGDGKHVHHIDNNGYNCRPENLILLSPNEHSYVHGYDCRTPEEKKKPYPDCN